MMPRPTSAEAASALYGVVKLARFDRSGYQFLENSAEGFWKSFHAAVYALPFYGIILFGYHRHLAPTAGMFEILLVEIIAYVLSWVAFPVVAHTLCDFANRPERYVTYVVAFNWAKVPQVMVMAPVSLLGISGLAPDLTTALNFGISIAILVYIGFITVSAVNVGKGAAFGFVAVDFVISLLIRGYADSTIV